MYKILINNNFYINNSLYNSYKKPETKPVASDNFSAPDFNDSRCLNVFFTGSGLTKSLGKKLYATEKEIQELNEKFKHARGNVANLPREWVLATPEDSRKEHILNIFKAFDKATIELRSSFKQDDDFKDQSEAKAASYIKDSLVSADVISDKEKIILKEKGSGIYAVAYSFSVSDKDYVIKVFKKNNGENNHNGHLIEPNSAMYAQMNAPDGHFAKFYFANLNSGYMVTKMINFSDPLPEKVQNPDQRTELEQSLGFEYGDPLSSGDVNIIAGRIVDYGSFEAISPILAQNKTARWVYKQVITNEPETNQFIAWNNMYKKALSNHQPNSIDILKGLAGTMAFLKDEKQHFEVFKTIAESPLDEIKTLLIDELVKIPIKKRLEICKLILNNTSEDIAKKLANNLYHIDKEDRLELYKTLIKYDNEDIHKQLAIGIDTLPEDHVIKAFVMIANKSPESIKIALTSKFNYLKKDDRLFAFETLMKDASETIKIKLALNIFLLPNDSFIKYLDEFLKINNQQMKLNLANQLSYLPPKLKLNVFKTLLNGASDELKANLADKLNILMKEERIEGFKLFANCKNNDVINILLKQANYLPEEDKPKAMEILGQDKYAYLNK